MKLLLFSDLHEDTAAANSLVERSVHAEVLVGAGDFGNMRGGVRTCIDILRTIQRPTVLVPGNNESADELRQACADWPSATVLHGTTATIAGITIFGLGGGVPVTPFGDWSWDFTEAEAAAILASCPPGCLLISHSPPKGVVDRSSAGRSLGSTAVREVVTRACPKLVVCGHIHASCGQCGFLGATPVVNAGPRGMNWVLELPPDGAAPAGSALRRRMCSPEDQ